MSHFGIVGTRSSRMVARTAAVVSVLVLSLFAQSAVAQNGSPLTFENNYFVTGDYVVGGVGLRGRGVNGFATGRITIPDANTVPSTGVPAGADIAAAFLYWQTVESSGAATGQIGRFNGYPIAGYSLGNPNAPVSWSSGGCSGSSLGSKTIRTYRADVRSYLKVDPATGKYYGDVSLPDSGSNGGGTPLTLGASLVIIYRVVDKNVRLNSVIIYDGSFAPGNTTQDMRLGMQGFDEAAAGAIAKITHIAGNGQSNKGEQVYFLNDKTNVSTPLPSLYHNQPPFPGFYNGSWDNPTWVVSQYVNAEDASETTYVTSSGGCPSWGAVIFSTTVQDSDNDGLLDKWESDRGYCDAAVNNGTCNPGDSSWVPLPDADPRKPDVFVEADYMCSGTITNGQCATGVSYYPDDISQGQPVAMVTNAFKNRNINLHVMRGNVISMPPCTDDHSVSPPKLCQFPNQPGVVGWKGGFEFLKNQPLNTDPMTGKTFTEQGCEANPGACIRRFQHGKKDSYHYAIFGNSAGTASWSLQDGSLTSVVVAANGLATFNTSSAPSKLDPGNTVGGFGRVTVGDAITNPNLNGTWLVQSRNLTIPYSFTVMTTNVPAGTYDKNSDPNLAVAMGQAGAISGVSDIGGQDSLISLGSWGADGVSVNVQAGTMMHELGHALGLTHGGYYYDHFNDVQNQPNYTPTFESNCKPNYLSVMNYMFQVDLLGPDGTGLDYSSQQLKTLNESSLGGAPGVETTDGTQTAFSTTKWYDTVRPAVGDAATAHCDGTKLSDSDVNQPMYRYEGPVPPPASPSSVIPIAWSLPSLDIDFDGRDTTLRGFDDWEQLDLRQIGATGSTSVAGGIVLGGSGGILLGGSGGISLGGSGGILLGGSGGISLGGSGGVGQGEITSQAANSVVRPPTHLTKTPTDTRASHLVLLKWNAPGFGQIASYNLRRADGMPGWPMSVMTTSFTDSSVADCTTYTYDVTSVLALQPGELVQRQSVPSNSVQYAVPCPPTGLQGTPPVSNPAAVTLQWTAASTASGDILGYNVYRVVGTDTTNMTLLTPTPVAATNYSDASVENHTTYTYSVTAVPVDQTGCLGANPCRESTQASVTVIVQFKLQQTITFAQLPDKTYGNADFAVNATTTSGLPVSFTASPASNCTVSGNLVHIVHAGPCTITASQAGDDNYYPAPNVPNAFTINKANAAISVTPYSVTYNGDPHTATGTATGVFNENLVGGLDLSHTTHTNAGTYANDYWTFTDATGNYNNVPSTTITDSIAKANAAISVTPYSVTYDGNPHTAAGTATGVKGENLAGLDLSHTTHTNAGTYSSDYWTFTDVTGNYNNVATTTITDSIIKGNSITTITSISPSPSILGQAFTVNFTVARVSGVGIPTGSVTVSDVAPASCTGTLNASGAGSCVLTLPVLINGKPVVGTRTLTATYAGDTNFTISAGLKNQQVIYRFTGFYSPLSAAGDTSNSGTFNISKSITAKWNLQDNSGNYLGYLNSNTLYVIGPVQLINGKCPLPNQVPVLGSPGYPATVLYSPTAGAKGGSTFRISSSNNQFIFNWDTTGFPSGCYILELDLDSGQVERTTLKLQ